jgi:hypothetical protein
MDFDLATGTSTAQGNLCLPFEKLLALLGREIRKMVPFYYTMIYQKWQHCTLVKLDRLTEKMFVNVVQILERALRARCVIFGKMGATSSRL